MRWLLPASSVILLVCSAACSDEGLPLEIARLDTPLSSTVTTYADGGGLLARAVVTPSFVAYRGDGDAWVSLGALGPVTAYQIEHPRYTLWVACPGVEGEPTQVNLLFLTSEDTLEPAVLCDPAPPIDGLRSLSLVVGETNNRMLRMAAGSILSRRSSARLLNARPMNKPSA